MPGSAIIYIGVDVDPCCQLVAYYIRIDLANLSAGLRQLKPSLDEAGEDHDGLNSRE